MSYHLPLDINYAQRSDTGKRRRANEDASAVQELDLHDGQHIIIAAVADGMGGAQAGAEASQLATQTALQTLVHCGLNSTMV